MGALVEAGALTDAVFLAATFLVAIDSLSVSDYASTVWLLFGRPRFAGAFIAVAFLPGAFVARLRGAATSASLNASSPGSSPVPGHVVAVNARSQIGSSGRTLLTAG